jgi:hypothetical protein
VKKKLATLNLHRETIRSLASVTSAAAAAETGSNPHSACVSCTLANCPPGLA